MSETNLPFDEKFYPNNTQPSSGAKRKQEWEKSINNPNEFWAEKAKAINWSKQPTQILDDSNPPFFKWFPDGELNASYNTLDRHIKTNRKNKLAYIWEGEMGEIKTYTYYQLYREVNQLAKALKTAYTQ
jgi:acetyl-CoA synthetase